MEKKRFTVDTIIAYAQQYSLGQGFSTFETNCYFQFNLFIICSICNLLLRKLFQKHSWIQLSYLHDILDYPRIFNNIVM